MTGLSLIVAGGTITFLILIARALRTAPTIERPNFAEKELSFDSSSNTYNTKPIRKFYIRKNGTVLKKETCPCT